MCHPLAIGLGVGIFSAMANVSAAKSEAAHLNAVAKQKYELAKREAKRNNAIAQQEYENQLRIAHQKDDVNKRDHQRKTEAWAAALNANLVQSEVNAKSANLAMAGLGQKKKGLDAKAAFDAELALSEMIAAQGEVLATGKSGQSFLLQTTQAEKAFGGKSERIDELLDYETLGLNMEMQGVIADYLSAETQAYNNLPSAPVAEYASLLPFVPIDDPGPGKPIKYKANIGAAILGGVASGVGATPTDGW